MNSLTPRLDALPILLIYPQNQKPQAAIHHLQSRARRSRTYGGKNHTEDKEKMVVEDVAAFPNNKKKMFVIQHNLQDGIGARPSPIRWCCWWFLNLLKTPPATNEKYDNWPQ
ncbi:Hypothetical predicted protein [Olea europaea subsp. europaea]|uniref:Uncharacterized protein n=1 Tax=Olea europaea subsp. europaea TaxID=158383 RepID=A0A8S0PNF0_OLEEU|nr:Hypothetical predicted protein [Olea europaea subsp. europaea]